jgi:hypothetical protein
MSRWRQRLVAAVLAGALTAPALGQETYDPDIQRAFIEGVRLFEAGDHQAAARMFRDVLRRTNSPRVKLELARALFFLRDYRESRALFQEVQLEPDIPWQVRDNIDAFVNRIDDIIGYVRFSVSVVSDSNPRNITSQREFTIGGVRLTFLPPEDNKRVTGLRWGIQAHQPLLPESRVSAYFTGTYLDYETADLDRLTVDGGIVKELSGQLAPRLRAGVEAGTFGDRRLYDFPYLGYLQPLYRAPTRQVQADFKLGRVNFPHFRHLDADYASATVNGVQVLSPTVLASLGGTLEDSSAREAPYSYYGYTVAPGLAWLIMQPALLVRAELAVGERRYGDIDPLFGDRRRDRRTRLDIAVRSKQWRFMNFTPVLIFSIDRTRSNLPFYSYEKANVSIAME